jgi:hypothetical protein
VKEPADVNRDSDKIETTDPEFEALLKSLAEEWAQSSGIGSRAARVFFNVGQSSESDDFTNRLLDRVRRASQLRIVTCEMDAYLHSAKNFGEALANYAQSQVEESSCTHLEESWLSRIRSARSPLDISIDDIRILVKDYGLPFVNVFVLVAHNLEQDFVKARNSLVHEGLSRTSRKTSKLERQQEDMCVAEAVMNETRKKYLAYLRSLINENSEPT